MTTTLPAPAPSSPPPPLSPGGRTALRVVVILAAAALVIGVVVSLSSAAWGISGFRVVQDSMPLPNTLTSLTVDTGSVPAAVRITTDREAREPRVDMRMVNSRRAESNPLAVAADGTSARVTIDAERTELLRWGRAGEITVVLPPELARRVSVTTQQEVGVLFAQADVDRLTARTEEGAVVLSGSARRIDITTDHGEVTTREAIAVSESFRATTTNGEVDVEFSEAPQNVNATTGNGEITIALPPPGPYFVDAATDMPNNHTDIEVPQTRDRDNAAAVITGRTETGEITVKQLD